MILTLCFVIDAMLRLLTTACLRSAASSPQGSVSLSSALLSAGKAINDTFGPLGPLFPKTPMNIVALMFVRAPRTCACACARDHATG